MTFKLPDYAREAAAMALAKWLGYVWEGLGDNDLKGVYPDWHHHSQFGLSFQGGKPAVRRAVDMIETAAINAMLDKGDAKRAEEMPCVPSTIILREGEP
jgi:hypothetical protein